METAIAAMGSPSALSQDTKQSQGAGAAHGMGREVNAVLFPGSHPGPQLWSPLRAGTSLHARLSRRIGPRMGEREEAGRGINHGWSQ